MSIHSGWKAVTGESRVCTTRTAAFDGDVEKRVAFCGSLVYVRTFVGKFVDTKVGIRINGLEQR